MEKQAVNCSIKRLAMCGVLCAILASVSVTVVAQEKPAAVSAAVPAAVVETWIGQLTSRDFQARRQASKRLVALGRPAIEAVAKAADGGDLERTTRCIALLKQWQASEDVPTRTAAGAALKRLASSANKTVAARAEAALPKPDPKASVRRPGGITIQIQGGGVARNGTRVSIRTVNGQRRIEVSDGERKFSIEDKNGKDIRIKISQRTKGKIVTREVKAATVDELMKKDAEAYGLYKKYAGKNAGGIQIRNLVPGFPKGLRPRALPGAGLRGLPDLPLPPFSSWGRQVAVARKSVDRAVARLQTLAGQPAVKPAELREVLKELVVAQKTLAKLLGDGKRNVPGARRVPKAAPPAKPAGAIKT
jgi:hypothetical protein